MTRIGGGGPIIPPQGGGARGPAGAQKGDFASKVQQAQTQGTDAARTQQAKQAQASRIAGGAKEIAQRLKAGSIQEEEATREFVGLVIEERWPEFKKKKRRKGRDDDDEPASPEEQLEDAVTELINSDPVLFKRLQTQFQRMAKG